MTVQESLGREATIAAAIQRAYEDAGVEPPTVASPSRIVALQQLVLEQGLPYREHPGLTRGSAATVLSGRLRRTVEVPGAPGDQLSGYLYAAWPEREVFPKGEILVNRDDPVARRRFTVAHELGHFLLHALPVLEDGATVFSEAQPSSAPTDTAGEFGQNGEVRIIQNGAQEVPNLEAWELEANQFAAELLMPADLCRALVSQVSPQCGDRRDVLAKRLASELLVSQQAMLRRLTDLGLGVA